MSSQEVLSADEAKFSKRVSDMVLAGWALSDEFCPVYTSVPLVVNNKGQKYSVALERYVDTAPATPATKVPRDALQRKQNRYHDEQVQHMPRHLSDTDVETVRKQATKRPHLSSSTSLRASNRSDRIQLASTKDTNEILDPYEVLRATQRTLVAKMKAAEDCLQREGTENTQQFRDGGSRAQRLAALIRECGEALLALREVSGD